MTLGRLTAGSRLRWRLGVAPAGSQWCSKWDVKETNKRRTARIFASWSSRTGDEVHRRAEEQDERLREPCDG